MREEVFVFAQMMDSELTANEKKGDWTRFINEKDILWELEYHKAKLLFTLKFDNEEEIKEYAADCANALLFILNSRNLCQTKKS